MRARMDSDFLIRGVNPLGRIVELRLTAPSADEAKKQAEGSGLRYVVVHGLEEERLGEAPSEGPASDPLR